MRRIGKLSQREEADRFGDFLLTKQIKAQIDPADDGWAIWVFEEDRIDDAKSELDQFQADPQADRYKQAVIKADRLRHEEVRKRTKVKKNTVNMAERWRRPMIVQIPVTFALVVISVAATLGTRFGEEMNTFGGRLTMVPVRSASNGRWIPIDAETGQRTNGRGLDEIRSGQVWRLVTPIFIHLTVLHLIFNMYWTVVFGSLIETRRGTWTMLLLVLATAIVSNFGQYYFQSIHFGGISGVGYGLFGYLWIFSKVNPRSQLYIPPNLVFLFIAWLVICMTPAIPAANHAHVFGLLSGMLIGALDGRWRKHTGST